MAIRGRKSQTRVETADRKAKALELRRAGVNYERIAQECGYANAAGAWKAVERALRDMIREPGEEVLCLELDRLDRLMVGVWPAAREGKVEAVDRVLKIMDRRARLLGLDAPVKVETDVTSQGKALTGASLQTLLAQMTIDELNALEPIFARLAARGPAGELEAPQSGEVSP